MLYAPLNIKTNKNYTLLDTGAVQSAMSENKLRNNQTTITEALLIELAAPAFKIQIATRMLLTVKKQIVLKFFTAGCVFEDTQFFLLTMGTVLTRISLFGENAVLLDANNNLVHLPDMYMQVRKNQTTCL